LFGVENKDQIAVKESFPDLCHMHVFYLLIHLFLIVIPGDLS